MKPVEIELPGYEGLYRISSDGRFYSVRYRRYLLGGSGGKGYRMLSLHSDRGVEYAYLHRLVATNFLRPPVPGETVNHIDGNRLNNAVENLEWCTNRENLAHARRVGLNRSRPEPRYGFSNPHTKMSAEQVISARARRAAGERVVRLAEEFGLSAGAMSHVLSGKRRAVLRNE